MSDSSMQTPVSLNTAYSVAEPESLSPQPVIRPVTSAKVHGQAATACNIHVEQGATSPLSVGTLTCPSPQLPEGCDELVSCRGSHHLTRRQEQRTTVNNRKSLVIAGFVSTGVLLLGAGAIVAWTGRSPGDIPVSDSSSDLAQLGNNQLTASCTGSPCANGGVCHDLVSNTSSSSSMSFYCQCQSHFTGHLCESGVSKEAVSPTAPSEGVSDTAATRLTVSPKAAGDTPTVAH